MSRREIKACDTVDPESGICNREASGTCPLCEKDFCSNHVSSTYATVRVGLSTGSAQIISPSAGYVELLACRVCVGTLQTIFTGAGGKLRHVLPTKEVFVEALRALLASETMKGKTA